MKGEFVMFKTCKGSMSKFNGIVARVEDKEICDFFIMYQKKNGFKFMPCKKKVYLKFDSLDKEYFEKDEYGKYLKGLGINEMFFK